MPINQAQKRQIDKQLRHHSHPDYEVNIKLAPGHWLYHFCVNEGVMKPELMTSVWFARWLMFNNGLYAGKKVLDLGSGSGILGVVMGMYGAAEVAMSDISPEAIANSRENVAIFSLLDKAQVIESDLFENIEEIFDVIVFNHPFFDGVAEAQDVSTSMLGGGGLIHRFFEQAWGHMSPQGVIVMPYYHLAGPANDPSIQGPKHGYTVIERMLLKIMTGLQKGPISIHELRR